MPSRHHVEIIPAHEISGRDFRLEWERLRESTPAPTAFASPVFAEATASAFGYDLVGCMTRGEDRALSGGVLCYARRMGPYTRLVVPPFVQYTPLLQNRPPADHEIHAGSSVLQVILGALREQFGAVALHLLPELRDLRAAGWAGFRVRPLYTYRIDLEAGASIQSTWSENALRLFRRFTDDFEIQIGSEHAGHVIDLCAAGYARHGRRLPVAAERLEALVQQLSEAGRVQVFALHARSSGECEAGVIVLHDRGVAHYWIAGSRPGPAMTVLLGNVLQHLAEDGIAEFDFVGANTPSIAEFKRKFGPRLVPYHRVEYCGAVGLRLLDFVRRRNG